MSTTPTAKDFVMARWAETPVNVDASVTDYAKGLRGDYSNEYPDADLPSVDSFRRYVYHARDLDPEPEQPKPENIDAEEYLTSDLIYHNAHDDVYVVYFPHHAKTSIFPGEKYRQMKRDYSNWDGDPSTINDIIRAHGINRKDFIFLKKESGWTHGSGPFTAEELVNTDRDIEEYVKDLAVMRERAVERAYQKRMWKETEKKAAKLDSLMEGVWDPLADHVVKNPPRRDVLKLNIEQLDYLSVFSPADLHIGKLGVDGYSIASARRDVLETTDELVGRLASKGKPGRNILVLGNDWWHVDNPQGSTTAGTPQDVDGLPEGIIPAGYETAVEVTDRLRVLGPLEIVVVPSNHSNWGDYHMASALKLAYREHDDVTVHENSSPRQYIKFGRCLLGLEHGDGAKGKDLPLIMGKECPKAWGETTWRYWLTAHLHHIKEVDEGVHILQAPSLSGSDKWHSKNGYVLSDRGNVCYLFDSERGHVTRELALAEPLHEEDVKELLV